MEDWALALGIVLCAILWVHIFVDYRRKLTRVIPGVEEVERRKRECNEKISNVEASRVETVNQLEEMRQEIERMEEQRVELQCKLNERDMVTIPAGTLRMGSNSPDKEDENPEHRVHIKSFLMDRYEVTNLQYKDFVDVTGHRKPIHWQNGTFPVGQADHPTVNVSWEDAYAYAEWVGKRLPTEAEWEWAARGTEYREYAWGKQCSAEYAAEYANFANSVGKTTAVNKFPLGVSAFGIWDMCGNVGEWVGDWYEVKYYARSPEANPPGPLDGTARVYRGGGYHTNRIDIRAAARHSASPNAYHGYIGFRCARDIET